MDSNKGQLSSISSASDLIDARLEDQHRLYGSKHCPGCGHKLEGSKLDWLGLPAGVKFDPTDQELIEHLEAKVESGNSNKSHPLIDEFIPILEGEDGICYTHPEKLPGVTRDGLSRHFFHRPSKAYTTGTRKRRKIQTECDLQGGETRWHKTGKTRPVTANGKQKGYKKILVLYTNFGKNRKPEKTNWVMHQYHLGQHEEEREGELVVSKIFYQTQPRQCNWLERSTTSSTATTVGPSEGSGGASDSGRRDGGGGGGSISSKEVVVLTGHHRDDLVVGGAAMGTTVAGYTALEIHQQLKGDPFSYVPFRKGFDEAGIGGGDATLVGVGREGMTAVQAASMSAAACEEVGCQHHQQMTTQQQEHHPHQQMAFHVRRPTHPISQMISPPPLHHASMMLDDHHDSFHVPRIILPNDSFQQHQPQQQTEQQHHKIGGRSASGLEEIIMGCTSSSSTDIKEESSITNPQDAEWLMKYSTSFWPDPDNPDHHG